jgi:hypothetical protein
MGGSPTPKQAPTQPTKTIQSNESIIDQGPPQAPKLAAAGAKGGISAEKPDRKHLLESIRFVESSGGRALDHAWIDSGPHAGTRAIGSYAFMPKTVHELVSKSPRLKKKHAEVLSRESQGGIEDYFVEHPEFEHELANNYVDNIFAQTPAKDAGEVGYAWLHGIRGLNDTLKSGKDITADERHQKITAAYNNSKKLHDNRVNLHLSQK